MPHRTRPRAVAGARRMGRVVVSWVDVLWHWRDPQVRRWGRVVAGARFGHFTVPSYAVATSLADAADFRRREMLTSSTAVLDVGAGNGRQAIGLLELGVGRYVGLDTMRECVEFGNRAFRAWHNVRFDWLDAANGMYNPGGAIAPTTVSFPYGDAEFDLVIAGSLFTHLETIEAARRYLGEIARVLRPGGAVFTTWFRSPPNDVSADAARTVFGEESIRTLVETEFIVEDAFGGASRALHDQWRLYLRRRRPSASSHAV